jgi:hypothetical protein
MQVRDVCHRSKDQGIHHIPYPDWRVSSHAARRTARSRAARFVTLLEATQALQRVARLAVRYRLLSPLEALWWLAAATLEVIESRSL